MRSFSRKTECAALAIVAIWATSGVGQAQSCFICDDLVILSDVDAECFLKMYDSDRKEAHEKGFTTVDLSNCTNAADQEKRGSIDKPLDGLSPKGDETTRSATRSSYVLDLSGIDCLHKLVGVQPRPIDPTATFDLQKSCSAK